MRNRSGFTLIELLIVLAIIAIVAAMMLPAILEVREMGRQTACLSSLKQLAAAAHLYATDFDEILVGTEQGEDQELELVWGDLLQPYLRNTRILQCPSAEVAFEMSPPQPGYPRGISEERSYNYAINDVRGSNDVHAGAAFAPLAAIVNPTNTILFVDGWPLRPDDELEGDPQEIAWEVGHRMAADRTWDDGNPRHHSGFNRVFVDGHTSRRTRPCGPDGRFSGGTRDIEWLRAQ